MATHRQSFAKTTVLAVSALVLLLVATVMSAVFIDWRSVGDHLALWASVLAIGAGVLALIALAGGAALIAIGGMVVLYRDSCEERGVPYAPARPRERIIGPMTAAVRRRVRPKAPWRPGEVVEVRTLPEILSTLDERGCLEGMPFMPEMVAYCGHRMRVHRRVEKVWEYAHGTGLRRMQGAVLLESSRCDGGGHGGCQAACQLIWKEAWLRRPGAGVSHDAGIDERVDLISLTQAYADGAPRYFCQMTEIKQASTQFSMHDARHYWRDMVGGNVRFVPLVVVLSVRTFNAAQFRLKGALWPVLKPLNSAVSPQQAHGFQPGQWVRVKSKAAVESTLNRDLRNRGLEFATDMLSHCGGSYRVRARVERIVDERTGALLEFKTPSITLDGVHADGGTLLAPHNEFFFWREIWLEPEPTTGGQRASHDRSGAVLEHALEQPMGTTDVAL